MKRSLKDADLKKMSAEEQKTALREFARVAKSLPNGELRDVEQQIALFETRYQVSSAELRQSVAAGTRQETWEICQWLMLLDQRDLLGARKSRSH